MWVIFNTKTGNVVSKYHTKKQAKIFWTTNNKQFVMAKVDARKYNEDIMWLILKHRNYSEKD